MKQTKTSKQSEGLPAEGVSRRKFMKSAALGAGTVAAGATAATFADVPVDAGVRGVITSATVIESEKQVYVGVQTDDGRAVILTEPMSDYELQVYREFPDTYFGVIQEISKNYTDPFEFYERMVEIHRSYPRERLIPLFPVRSTSCR